MTMKKTFKAIGIITVMGIMLVLAYLLGTTQAETINSNSYSNWYFI